MANLHFDFNAENDAGEIVDRYLPRKCSWTNKILGSKDHAAVQINIADIDPKSGIYTGTYKTIALAGAVRKRVRLSRLYMLVSRDTRSTTWRRLTGCETTPLLYYFRLKPTTLLWSCRGRS